MLVENNKRRKRLFKNIKSPIWINLPIINTISVTRTRTPSQKNTHLFSTFTIITLLNRFGIQMQFLIARFPLVDPSLIHQILNTVDEPKMLVL